MDDDDRLTKVCEPRPKEKMTDRFEYCIKMLYLWGMLDKTGKDKAMRRLTKLRGKK